VFSTIFFAKVTTDWFEGKELATAMSILVMSWPFGIAMGQIGHGWLATNFDWRWAFIIASSYCAISALLIMILFHSPPHIKSEKVSFGIRLTGNELLLTLVASSAWGLFNAGYVVYLSFGPSILIAQGMNTVSALGVISIASWIMIFSGALCGYIADRSGRPDLIVFICLIFSMLSLLSLCFTTANLMSVLIFGLIGMAPAGLIMALAAKAMRPENRALGMGIFFMGQFFLQGPAPGIAGWIYDNTLSPTFPMLFGIFLFLSTAIAAVVFNQLKKRIPLR
jgi:MFS family permease